jgi:thiamine biosynthesis lipoprotein
MKITHGAKTRKEARKRELKNPGWIPETRRERGRRAGPLVFFCVLCGFLFFSCSPQNEPRTRTEFLLGTVCSITVYGAAPEGVFSRAFSRVREIEERMSVNLPESEISRVNAAAGAFPVPAAKETLELVEAGLWFSRASGGAFNIAVGPLVELWGIGTSREAVPSAEEIASVLPRLDFTRIHVDKTAGVLFLGEKGMALDLGAIAKGYAADEAARVLREEGITRAVIDFGGNILVMGSRPDGDPWRIGVQNPASGRGEFLGILSVRDMAVVSSGVYERFFLGPDGARYHHILDTAAGYPVRNGLLQVTVSAKSSRDADALSTTLFALGLSAGMRFAEETRGIQALFVTEDKKIHATQGLRDIFRLTDKSFQFP